MYFLKIDVEGPELAVLEGAINIFRARHPKILLEVEEVHNPWSVQRIRESLQELGYKGSIIVDGVVRPIEEFRLDRDQNSEIIAFFSKSCRYINNMLFIQSDHKFIEGGDSRLDNENIDHIS